MRKFGYLSEHYENFLTYVKNRYENDYWHALPKDVAQFVRNSQVPEMRLE